MNFSTDDVGGLTQQCVYVKPRKQGYCIRLSFCSTKHTDPMLFFGVNSAIITHECLPAWSESNLINHFSKTKANVEKWSRSSFLKFWRQKHLGIRIAMQRCFQRFFPSYSLTLLVHKWFYCRIWLQPVFVHDEAKQPVLFREQKCGRRLKIMIKYSINCCLLLHGCL